MNPFALSFAIMLVFVLGELLILKYARHQAILWRDVISNLNSGHILMWVLRGVEVFLFGVMLRHASMHLVDRWHPVLQWAFAFIAWDFCFYWMHRLHHKLPIFWAVHVVHHQGEHFNLSLGVRNSWLSSLTSFLFVAILAVLGVPLPIFLAVSSIHYTIQLYNHNALVNKSGFLEKFMITPSHHRVHHGTDPVYFNRNFGGTLLIWDKLFGTFQAERDDVEMRYGLPGNISPNNPLRANIAPFFDILKQRFPDFQGALRCKVPDFFIGTAGIILFSIVIFYVNQEGKLPAVQQLILFLLIFAGTIALGGLSDASRWGLLSWMLIALTLPVLYFAYIQVHDVWGQACFSLLLLHGMDALRRIVIAEASPPNQSNIRT